MKGWVRPGEDPVSAFRRTFVEKYWRDAQLPAVFYDPRPLAQPTGPRLHAKCIVVDEEVALVTSANFSEAAHTDTIEVGVVVRDPPSRSRRARSCGDGGKNAAPYEREPLRTQPQAGTRAARRRPGSARRGSPPPGRG